MAILTGTNGNDTLLGTTDDDTFTGGAGDDLIDGVAGSDVVVYSGLAQDYRFGLVSGRLITTDTLLAGGNDGTDSLARVQTLRFTDREYSVFAELRVNSSAAGDQRGPVACGLAGGSVLVAWQTPAAAGSGTDLRLQRLDAAGNVLGGELVAPGDASVSRSEATLAALGNGNAVLVWTAEGSDGSLGGVYAVVLDATGAATGGDFRVNVLTANEQRDAAVAPLAGGGFVVTWTSRLQDGSGEGIYMRRFSDTGAALGSVARVNTWTASDQKASAVAALADGGFLVAWQSLQQDGSGFGVYAQRFNAGGVAQGAEFRVSTTLVGHQLSPQLAGLPGGGAVVVWASQYQDGNGYGVYAQLVDAAGALVGAEVLVNQTTLSDQNAPVVCALGTGGFAVAWASRGQDGSGLGVYARSFDQNAQPATDEFRANATTLGHQFEPTLGALAGGGYALAWVGTDQDGDAGGIYTQLFDSSGAISGPVLVRGTAGNDHLDLSANGGLHAEGLYGDDTYVVNEANDVPFEAVDGGVDTVIASVSWTLATDFEDLVLSGAADIDATGNGAANRIDGNTGDNRIDGMAGNDLLAGGAGDDTYVVDAGDTVSELAGEGTDTVESVASWTLGSEFELLVLTGTAAIDGSGNALDNTITGNAADNTLGGLAGRDLLVGGAGNDTLQGGSGIDTVRGGAGDDRYLASASDVFEENPGEGHDLVSSAVDWTLAAEIEELSLTGSASLDGTGNAGANTMSGNFGSNVLRGLGGDDSINGFGAADTLAGGSGTDTLTGGGGSVADTFLFDTAPTGEADLITDFQLAQDRIALDDDAFTAFNAGVSSTVTAAQFYKAAGASAAQDANDRLIYDTASGALYYDPDGTGAAAIVQIATIGATTHANLMVSSFLIVA